MSMAATVVDDAGVDSYAQQTSLGSFRVYNDCKYKNEIRLSYSARVQFQFLGPKLIAVVWLSSNQTCSTPPSSPQTRLDEGIESFPEFQLCIGGGGQGELLDILKMLHCFMRAPRNYKKLGILHHCPKGVSLGL